MIKRKDILRTDTIDYIHKDDGLKRIDKYLFSLYPEYSRSYFQDLIRKDYVCVNSNFKVKCNYKLKNGDKIELNFPKPAEYNLCAEKVDFEVVDVQDDFIIINKPAGLIVHPSDNSGQELSLVHGLLYKFNEIEKIDNEQRPGIVHRLDRGTSGLLIVARNQIAQIKFSKLFKDRKIKKTYLAVVNGHPPKKGKISYSIGRHPIKRHLMSHLSYNGKKSLTYYKVLEYYKDSSLVEVNIVTGRTHQIRVHFASIGHGLLGDNNYGYQSKLITRPALHAYNLKFSYKDEEFKYTKEPPKDFKKLVSCLNINKRE